MGDLLGELDKKGIGSIATIGPGQVVWLMPFYSHGVWVPSPALNPSLPSFEVSVIRAAEIFVQPICEMQRQHLRSRSWNTALANTAEDMRQLRNFGSFQRLLCRDMGLLKEEWLWLCRATWEAWDAEGQS